MFRLPLCLVSLVLLLVLSCSKNEPETNQPDAAAIHYIRCVVDEKYDDYIQGMLSCDSASDTYKQQTKILLKQMRADMLEDNGKLKNITSKRTQMGKDNQSATVFLELTYENDSTENMMLPLIQCDKKWRLR